MFPLYICSHPLTFISAFQVIIFNCIILRAIVGYMHAHTVIHQSNILTGKFLLFNVIADI